MFPANRVCFRLYILQADGLEIQTSDKNTSHLRESHNLKPNNRLQNCYFQINKLRINNNSKDFFFRIAKQEVCYTLKFFLSLVVHVLLLNSEDKIITTTQYPVSAKGMAVNVFS